MFDRAGIDISPVRRIIAPTRRVLDAARAAGAMVVYLKMGFRPDLADAGPPDTPTWIKHLPLGVGNEVAAPDGSPGRVLIRGTWNTEIIDELAPGPHDLSVDKHRYRGFFETGLDELLRKAGMASLVFVGATTSVCVDSTVRDAMFRADHCLVLEDCVAEPIGKDAPRTNHAATLLVLEILFGSITDSASFITALQPIPV